MKAQNSGFTLIELIISVFILIVAVIGVYNSFSIVVVSIASTSSNLTASYLAQEGIEIVRNIRDSNWLNNRDWKTGLSDENTDCSNGCEADYKIGTPSWPVLIPWTSDGNYLNIKNNFYSYDKTGNFSPTKFKRKITITASGLIINPVLKVSVLVTWQEKEETFDTEVEEYLYDWY